jgi:hypothetical protein
MELITGSNYIGVHWCFNTLHTSKAPIKSTCQLAAHDAFEIFLLLTDDRWCNNKTGIQNHFSKPEIQKCRASIENIYDDI